MVVTTAWAYSSRPYLPAASRMPIKHAYIITSAGPHMPAYEDFIPYALLLCTTSSHKVHECQNAVLIRLFHLLMSHFFQGPIGCLLCTSMPLLLTYYLPCYFGLEGANLGYCSRPTCRMLSSTPGAQWWFMAHWLCARKCSCRCRAQSVVPHRTRRYRPHR